MLTKRRTTLLLMVIAGLLFFVWRQKASRGEIVQPLPASSLELSRVVDGTQYHVDTQGFLYIERSKEAWERVGQPYQRPQMEAAYQLRNKVLHRVEGDEALPVKRTFQESFDKVPVGVEGARKLIGPEYGWGALTLQTSKTPTVKAYVKLRNQIMKGERSFEDAIVMPDGRHAVSGAQSLYCECPAKTSSMITSKASISSPLVYFKKGDDFWCRFWLRMEDARPLGILDLECEWIEQHAGIRLLIDESGAFFVELKALDKPTFRQLQPRPVPLDKWVQVQLHWKLSEQSDGVVEVWQDQVRIIDQRGQTLPFASVIYSSLEIGISAHSYGSKTARLWMDDLQVSDQPFPTEPK